jgi:hypothetical protein
MNLVKLEDRSSSGNSLEELRACSEKLDLATGIDYKITMQDRNSLITITRMLTGEMVVAGKSSALLDKLGDAFSFRRPFRVM